jgi:hypothetical protein
MRLSTARTFYSTSSTRRTAQRVCVNFMNQYGMMLLILVVLFGGRFIYAVLVPIVNFLAGVQLLAY